MVSSASKILNTKKIKEKILDSLTGDQELDSLIEEYLDDGVGVELAAELAQVMKTMTVAKFLGLKDI
jgi:hypothetical protein